MADTELGSSPGKVAGDVDFVALPPGAKIGRYEVLSVLGQGGFGITYRARDQQLHRDVAIKEYLPTSLAVRQDGITVLPRSTKVAEDFTWGRERFISEGRTLASLHTAPAIVRVFDFLEINGTAYIVMELVQGDTLENLLKKRGTIGPDEVDAIIWPLLDGLEQVHAAGFLHRDIKPANILMGAGGKPTLIDFGASRAAMAGRTTAMTAIFTPGYAAGEQMTSAKQGPWTDIYGLSATLYHALTGNAPPSAFDRMLDDGYEPLVKLAPKGFAPGLLIGIDAGLAVRAAERPQSIAGWRPLLGQTSAGDSDATAVLSRPAIAPVRSQSAASPTVQPTRQPTITPATAAATAEAAPPAPGPVLAKSRTGIYAAIAAVVLFAGAGGAYLALSPKAPTTVAVQDMKVEELEKVLEARRRADAEAAEKRRAEEEAQRKVASDAAAKRAADADVERAQQQRQKAEEELAKLRAEIENQRKTASEQRAIAEAEEARRKAEAEMAALRQAEEDAKRRAAQEAEAKRLADEALAKAQAERQKADADARARAEEEAKRKSEADAKTRAEAEARAKADAEVREKAEAEAKVKAEEAKKKAEEEAKLKAEAEAERRTAEAAETALRLGIPERQRIQVALTALGFDTRGTDGAFGTRSREMIGAWQKARNQQPTSGYLTGTQHQALLREAAPALQKYDDEQKKAEEAKKKAEEEAKQKAAVATPPAAAPAPASPTSTPQGAGPIVNGPYSGTLDVRFSGGYNDVLHLSVTLNNGSGSGTVTTARCGNFPLSIRVDASGAVAGELRFSTTNCGSQENGRITGRTEGNRLLLDMASTTTAANGRGRLAPGTSAPAFGSASPPPPTPAAPATPGVPAGEFDGVYGGTLASGGGVRPTTLRITGTTGAGTFSVPRCGDTSFTVKIAPNGDVSGDGNAFDGSCGKTPVSVRGRIANRQVQLTLSGPGASLKGTLLPQ